MAANNEIGVLQDLETIGALCHHALAFHSDATQAIGKIPFDVRTLPVHLVLAPQGLRAQGVWALYIRRDGPEIAIEPLIDGEAMSGVSARGP